MITADVRRAIWDAACVVPARGELTADGSSLRPVPDGLGGGSGRYASTLPYLLAAAGGADPRRVAGTLAGRLRELPWVAGTAVTGSGYLTVAVTDQALAGVAVRIVRAGAPACAHSDILRAVTMPAAQVADLATAASWAEARAQVAAEATVRLARAAGADIVAGILPERRPAGLLTGSRPGGTGLSEILAFAGPGMVRYALLAGEPAGSIRWHLDSPVYAVRYAHAHAASTLRQAADLGIVLRDEAEPGPCLLTHPTERVLLGVLSWLPERVAGAARRGQPRELTRYLEELAAAYYDCRERCPALPFGGRSAPRDARAGEARLWLVAAARTALAAGLGLLGVGAPDRL